MNSVIDANADALRLAKEAADANKAPSLVAKEIVFAMTDDVLIEHFKYVVEMLKDRHANAGRTARLIGNVMAEALK